LKGRGGMAGLRFTATRWPRPVITGGLAIHDIVMAALAMQLAIWLRNRFPSPSDPSFDGIKATLVFSVIAAGVFYGQGLHRGVWRFTAFSNLVSIMKAATITVLIFVPTYFLVTRLEFFPRTVILFVWPLLVTLLAAPRYLYRLWTSGTFASLITRDDPNRVPVLVVGLTHEADRFIRETQIDRNAQYSVLGILDPDPAGTGRHLRGVKILGTPDQFVRILHHLAATIRVPQKIILSPGVLDGAAVRALMDEADRQGLTLARLPHATALAHAPHAAAALQPVDVGDLLGRPQKRLDRVAMQGLIAGKRVLVTGAGGTIGGELCRQIAALGPASLSLFDNSEYALYQIDLELGESEDPPPRTAVLADVRDRAQMDRLIGGVRPDVIFHAAALKHVPLVEANPAEGVRTNVGGTRNVADAARAHGVPVMVLISTDKAVHPSSVMGATKRIAELYCQALQLAGGPTRFVTVRFGNVLGSTGSVVPLFQRQLARGGPLTVTDPHVSRYFMTVREAVELVLQAASLPPESDSGAEGAPSHIFVLDMGEPVLIADLARQMIRLAGLRPEEDVAIVYTGLRPGEKLHEQLFHEAEPSVPTTADGILLATPRILPLSSLAPVLDRLLVGAESRDEEAVLGTLSDIVPEFGRAEEPVLRAVLGG
jgi:FlaA1/EpsC-like NDP-sugar epimerase